MGEYPAMYLVTAALFILLIPYIRHYYFLEKSVKKMYDQYEKLKRFGVSIYMAKVVLDRYIIRKRRNINERNQWENLY